MHHKKVTAEREAELKAVTIDDD